MKWQIVSALLAITALGFAQTTATTADQSLALTLPKNWVHAKKDNPAYTASLADLKKSNLAVAKQLDAAKDTFALYAFDRSKVGSGYFNTLNIQRTKAPFTSFESKDIPDIRKVLSSIKTVRPMVVTLVKTKYGNGIYYSGTLVHQTLKARAKNDMAAYLIMHPDKKSYYTITFNTPEGNLGKTKSLLDSMFTSVILK